MDPDSKKKIQIILVISLLLAGARTWWVFHERNAASFPAPPPVHERNPDDYVYLRPSHAHDLASTKAAIAGKTVWVRAGNMIAYVPYKQAGQRDAQTKVLAPLAALDIKDVVMSGSQMLAIFTFQPSGSADSPSGALFAAPIGAVKHGDATILIDDIFFLEDPHKLYDHWPKETWAAVEHHEIQKGMSETQAAAAMGVGHPPDSSSNGDYGNRTLQFSDGVSDKLTTVRFENNQVVSVTHQ